MIHQETGVLFLLPSHSTEGRAGAGTVPPTPVLSFEDHRTRTTRQLDRRSLGIRLAAIYELPPTPLRPRGRRREFEQKVLLSPRDSSDLIQSIVRAPHYARSVRMRPMPRHLSPAASRKIGVFRFAVGPCDV